MGWIVKTWRHVPAPVRLSIINVVQRNNRLYRWLLFRHVDAKDRAAGVASSLPPAELRYRVSSTPDAEAFVAVGKRCAGDIQDALARVGRELGSFERVLDFGCGCGRTLIHLKNLAPKAELHGTDIDARAIEWCKRHLTFARFKVSVETPPVDYPSETFDFIYAISVFTHLDEDYQFRWLEELSRIAKPGAIVLLTVDSALVGDRGFVFHRSYEEGLFPAWYQNAYHSREYVIDKFGRYFSILAYLVKGMNEHQDVVMLRKV
ncbi:MAG TPA: class I SAM-dependent methyltransferase [Pyrinomonadaceae bacterium]|nr:class I SAM-dependent methyltransferase [Pyrinomonadaceae bacterium]